MGLEIIILSEVSQTMKDKLHMISPIGGIKKKKDTKELICSTETNSQTGKLIVTVGNRWGGWGDGPGIWDWQMHTKVYGMIGQQRPAI